MNPLIRIAFAIVVGIAVTALLEWLLPSIPRAIDVLAGIIAGFIAWHYTPLTPVV